MGANAAVRRGILTRLAATAELHGCTEVVLPSVEFAHLYEEKAGAEVLEQMYTFPDRKGRGLCLRPEGTATVQALAHTTLKMQRDVKLWYEARCWRYERPQAGRYREFTQFGVEVIWPRADAVPDLIALATSMIAAITPNYVVTTSAKRGLAYYVNGDGFEISCPELGAQQQVCGGGAYAEGAGFAFGVDRLMLLGGAP